MPNLLTRKLDRFAPLPVEDMQLLDDIIKPTRVVPADTDIIREGQSSDNVRLILEGFACRYKILANGRRQIVGYMLPGDFCDLHVAILKTMDHNIGTLTPCTVVDIPRVRILELTERPAIARAFWWVTLVDEATLREWLLNIGQRSAVTRIAHLFCELIARLQVVGLVHDDIYKIPLTQTELGDTTGISFVHVNRCMHQLRGMGFITRSGLSVVASKLPEMIAFCGFNPNYLHLGNSDGVAATARPGQG